MSQYDKLWIKAMESCFDHEGKVIPYFWLKNKNNKDCQLSWIEHLTTNQKVGGSNPPQFTKINK